jgi:ComF family protein
MGLKRVISDFFHLFYPNICQVCHNDLAEAEKVICSSCLYHIPRTKYWLDSDNPVAKIFWGRVFIENACSFFFFAKGSKYRKLLHYLKYHGRQEIGVTLGKEFGYELKRIPNYSSIDCIIPVPLHAKRLKQRGYNQAECIARGLEEALERPIITDVLIRSEYTQTQTKKSRVERIQNVSNAFILNHPEKLENKHVLLVDDVITTGATLEVCASTLLLSKNTKVSIVSLAYASS